MELLHGDDHNCPEALGPLVMDWRRIDDRRRRKALGPLGGSGRHILAALG